LSRFLDQLQTLSNESTPKGDNLLADAIRQLELQVREDHRRALSQALATFTEAVRPAMEGEIRANQDKLRALLRREVVNGLLATMRRLRTAQDVAGWRVAFLDGALEYVSTVALFNVGAQGFRLEETRGLDSSLAGVEQKLQSQWISPKEAAALHQVVESKDTVIAMISPAQVSTLVASLFAGNGSQRVHLFPILRGEQLAGILYCPTDDRAIDVGGLELLCLMAGETLVSRNMERESVPAGLVGLTASVVPSSASSVSTAPSTPPAANIGWQAAPLISSASIASGPAIQVPASSVAVPAASTPTSVSSFSPANSSLRAAPEVTHRDDQEHHLRAARWAKANVARLFLDQSDLVLQGRRQRRIYESLRPQLEELRAKFNQDFFSGSTSMMDYLHDEFVDTLAGGDEGALGDDYPGPLS
jgi:hypothetical protein